MSDGTVNSAQVTFSTIHWTLHDNMNSIASLCPAWAIAVIVTGLVALTAGFFLDRARRRVADDM